MKFCMERQTSLIVCENWNAESQSGAKKLFRNGRQNYANF